jgi:hypothetical protein
LSGFTIGITAICGGGNPGVVVVAATGATGGGALTTKSVTTLLLLSVKLVKVSPVKSNFDILLSMVRSFTFFGKLMVVSLSQPSILNSVKLPISILIVVRAIKPYNLVIFTFVHCLSFKVSKLTTHGVKSRITIVSSFSISTSLRSDKFVNAVVPRFELTNSKRVRVLGSISTLNFRVSFFIISVVSEFISFKKLVL